MEELTKFLDKYCNNKYKEGVDIDLSHRKITKLPDDFGNVKCVELNLNDNLLEELPESFGDIECNSVYLHNNKLAEIPQCISRLKCNWLFLNNNPLKSGLRWFKDWEDDVKLSLQGTPLFKEGLYEVKDYRREIDMEWELWNNKDLEGAKDCYDSGLFSFKQ